METQEIIIRPIEDADYEALLDIDQLIWTAKNTPAIPEKVTVAAFKERMSTRTIFVAELAGKVVGFVDVHHPTQLEAHKKQWMIGIGVDPTIQSKGIGGKLLNYLKEVAPTYGIHKISLRVMGTNTEAIRFYKKHGFIQEACFKDEFYLNNQFLDDYQFAYFIH